MAGYPALHPAGFVEFDDPCSGPALYRNQPSRESRGVLLSEYMNKYNVGQYKGGDFIRMATDLKNTSRSWNRLPAGIRKQFLDLMLDSDSGLAEDLAKRLRHRSSGRRVEQFGNASSDNRMGIFVVVVVAVVALVIGFLISMA